MENKYLSIAAATVWLVAVLSLGIAVIRSRAATPAPPILTPHIDLLYPTNPVLFRYTQNSAPVLLFVNGILQLEGVDYQRVGDKFQFERSLSAGDTVQVLYWTAK